MPAIRFIEGHSLPVENIYCIGRNYMAHAAELGNTVEAEPVVFLKPTSALLHEEQFIELPSYSQNVQFEAELVLVIDHGGRNIPRETALNHVAGYGIGLDLTARDIQTNAKEKGLPWTVGKGFDGAACVSRFISADALPFPNLITFSLDVNGHRRQNGDCRLMVHDLSALIAYLSSRFTLQRGDLIYTGTPAGVGSIYPGDQLTLRLGELIACQFVVAGAQ